MEIQNYVTLHRLTGRRCGAISRHQYDEVRDFILTALKQKGQVTLLELLESGSEFKVSIQFKGDLSKVILQVKEDLQVRGLIKVQIGADFVQRITYRKKNVQGNQTF